MAPSHVAHEPHCVPRSQLAAPPPRWLLHGRRTGQRREGVWDSRVPSAASSHEPAPSLPSRRSPSPTPGLHGRASPCREAVVAPKGGRARVRVRVRRVVLRGLFWTVCSRTRRSFPSENTSFELRGQPLRDPNAREGSALTGRGPSRLLEVRCHQTSRGAQPRDLRRAACG